MSKSKLDDILNPYADIDTATGQSIRFKPNPIVKQQIKGLMLEIVNKSNTGYYGSQAADDATDSLAEEIIKRIEEL